jgi:hypothetical protein
MISSIDKIALSQLHDLAINNIETATPIFWTSNNAHYVNSEHVYCFSFLDDIIDIIKKLPLTSNCSLYQASLTKMTINESYSIDQPSASNVTRFVIVPEEIICQPHNDVTLITTEHEPICCSIHDLITTSNIDIDTCNKCLCNYDYVSKTSTYEIFDDHLYEVKECGTIIPKCDCPHLLLQVDVIPNNCIEGYCRIPAFIAH